MEGDEWWSADDDDLVTKGIEELEAIGLMKADDVEAGYVVRMPKAYPLYDATYQANVEILRRWLQDVAPNVHPVGRNGMHKYNNQDHSMFTAMLTVDNLYGASHDIWAVNVEEEYHEESRQGSSS
jgi:UDP-galactopyranose mutase